MHKLFIYGVPFWILPTGIQKTVLDIAKLECISGNRICGRPSKSVTQTETNFTNMVFALNVLIPNFELYDDTMQNLVSRTVSEH
jgi:hypothetical protein